MGRKGSKDDPISIFLGPDPNFPGPGTPPVRMWELWPTGRLHPFDGALVVCSPEILQPRPALVKLAPWDTRRWLRTEHCFARQQEILPSAERRQLMEPWLVRVYDDIFFF